jgi:hypothetical protein
VESRRVGRVLAVVAVLMLAVGATSASAASPVLEFTSPLAAFPVPFTAEGGPVSAALSNFDTEVHCTGSAGAGSITGPRSATSSYTFTGCETLGGHECKTEGALEKEITTPMIEAELVFIDQAKKEVGMLLAPHGGVYMEFKCGGENVRAVGPFLSPVAPLNQEGPSFTASLFRSGATQVPNAYESLTGVLLPAVPTGEKGTEPAAGTGVELSFGIHTGVPLTVKAITAAEVEAKQREEEAAAKKRHDDEEAAKAAAAKKHDEEEAARKRQEEEAQKTREREHAKEEARARQRSKALKQCRKAASKQGRVRCERRAKKRFAPPKTAKA